MGKENKEKSCRILFVIRYFHPFIGGMENKALNIAACLKKRGVDVHVVTSRFERDWKKDEFLKGVSVSRLPSPRIKIVGALIFLFNLCIYLFKNRKSFDTVHAFQIGYSSAVAIFISKLIKKPAVLSLAASGNGGDIKRHLKTPWGIVFILLCRLASKMVILNREMEKELRIIQYNVKNIVHIPNGVDTKIFYPDKRHKGQEKKFQHIIFTGRLTQQKGLETLIYAFTDINKKFDIKLSILGMGLQYKKLNKMVNKLGLSGSIAFLGLKKNVLEYLHKTDIFVLPSHYEGMSNSLLEAMACGLPVIASDIPGNNDIIRDRYNGILFEDENKDALADAFTYLLHHPEKAKDIGLKARQSVIEYYSIEKIAEKHACLYQQFFPSKR